MLKIPEIQALTIYLIVGFSDIEILSQTGSKCNSCVKKN